MASDRSNPIAAAAELRAWNEHQHDWTTAEQTSVQAGQFADALGSRIRELQMPHLGSPSGLLTISAGYATETFEGDGTQEGLIERADSGLYVAKRAGRDRSAMIDAPSERM